MFISLINNIAFLIALVAAGQVVISRFDKKPLNRQILLGLLFGGVAVLGMANPLSFSPGVIFDDGHDRVPIAAKPRHVLVVLRVIAVNDADDADALRKHRAHARVLPVVVRDVDAGRLRFEVARHGAPADRPRRTASNGQDVNRDIRWQRHRIGGRPVALRQHYLSRMASCPQTSNKSGGEDVDPADAPRRSGKDHVAARRFIHGLLGVSPAHFSIQLAGPGILRPIGATRRLQQTMQEIAQIRNLLPEGIPKLGPLVDAATIGVCHQGSSDE